MSQVKKLESLEIFVADWGGWRSLGKVHRSSRGMVSRYPDPSLLPLMEELVQLVRSAETFTMGGGHCEDIKEYLEEQKSLGENS